MPYLDWYLKQLLIVPDNRFLQFLIRWIAEIVAFIEERRIDIQDSPEKYLATSGKYFRWLQVIVKIILGIPRELSRYRICLFFRYKLSETGFVPRPDFIEGMALGERSVSTAWILCCEVDHM